MQTKLMRTTSWTVPFVPLRLNLVDFTLVANKHFLKFTSFTLSPIKDIIMYCVEATLTFGGYNDQW